MLSGNTVFIAAIAFYVKEDIYQFISELKIKRIHTNIIVAIIGVLLFGFVGIVTVWPDISHILIQHLILEYLLRCMKKYETDRFLLQQPLRETDFFLILVFIFHQYIILHFIYILFSQVR